VLNSRPATAIKEENRFSFVDDAGPVFGTFSFTGRNIFPTSRKLLLFILDYTPNILSIYLLSWSWDIYVIDSVSIES
jgi:hypothetical protein